MNEIVLISITILVKLLCAVIGVVTGRVTLLWMDRNFEFVKKVEKWEDKAQAIYYGLRILGVFLLIGFALS